MSNSMEVSPVSVKPVIEASWLAPLQTVFDSPGFLNLKHFLLQEKKNKKVIYPAGSLIFRAFDLTPFDEVKVVILGQDPYHGPNQAMGLSFSVPLGVRHPPSLRNIFQEIQQDVGCLYPRTGDLTPWAQQGVLLLNTVLTVEMGLAHSHQGKGWEALTDAVMAQLSQRRTGLVFVLWGAAAAQKKPLIDPSKHLILTAAHPSPLSAHRGFLGCRHFSKINAYLIEKGQDPIDWCLP